MRTRQKRRKQIKRASKSNRVLSQQLIEAMEPRILMSTSWTVSDVADFNSTDGANPIAGVYRDSSGNLWGTTYNGGANSYGTIYKVAAGTNTVTTILNFNATNGSGPWGDMIADSSGNIYGTTAGGGTSGDGTVYKIAAGTNTVTTVASFNGTDGANPGDGLFLDSSGNLWGTTDNGGANNDGAVFKIASGSSSISLVASFNTSTGVYPLGGLVVDSSGNVYGTTKTSNGGVGGGVFEIPSGTSNINMLASFTSSSGYQPLAGLVRDSSGNLYGTAYSGGADGYGTVFELASGGNTITPLASFNGTNGEHPKDALILDSSGNLYGTAQNGGTSSVGTAFEVVNGSGTITTLASFNGTNGNEPQAKLTMDSSGNLYGTTYAGGANSDGNVFELTPHTSSQLAFTSGPTSITAGTSQSINVSVEDTGGTTVTTDTSTVTLSIASGPTGGTINGTTSVAAVNGVATFSGITFSKTGTYTLTATASNLTSATSSAFAVVPSYTFTDVADFNGTNGENPLAGLYRDSSGNLWGTTYNGGTYGYGTIYKIAAGTNTITNIFNFNGTDGRGPWENLIADSSGNLYGTTSEGGAYGYGEVYKITAGTNTVTTLSSFNLTNGNSPQEGLVLDSSGNLWGTANTGGANNDGGVFKISTAGGAISLVASFNSSTGANPIGGLIIDSSGNVYGITNAAGSGAGGTIYEIPSGGSSINVLASFTSTSGYGPYGALVRDSNGNLYGTTTSGGASSDGTVYELTSGGNTITPLASFNGTYGSQPRGSLLMDSSGNLYGTTYAGGANGDGTAFELVNGTGTIAMLASFNGTTGNEPWDNLTMDSSGNLYGTTWSGGANSDGNIFELTPHVSSKLGFTSGPTSITAGTSQSINVSVEDAAGATVTTDTSTVTLSIASGPTGGTISGTTSVAAVNGVATFSGLTFSTPGAYTLSATASNLTSATSSSFTIVPSYTQIKLADLSNSLGKQPEELVADSSGNFYGVTNQGGANNRGAVYKIAASTHAVTLLASFVAPSSSTGAYPQSGLTLDSSGNLWGTTSQGGTNSAGVIFKIANGSSTITTVASLPEVGGYISSVNDNMAIDSSGNLFGASQGGGDGFLFELPAGSSTVTNLHTFSGSDGANPAGSVIVDSSGNLYGTTYAGGANSDGTVFKFSSGTLTTLVTFNGTNGSNPEGTPVMDSNGNLFGTTATGGANGDGTVWEIAHGTSTLTTLATFNNTNGNGPERGQLLIDSAGNLYGTTNVGGNSSDGTAWELPAGTGTIVPITNFNSTTGYNPPVGLLMDSAGNLFGATTSGAANSLGAVYELSQTSTQAVITSQPTTVTAGTSQSITVNLESAAGVTDQSNTATVTLSIASGPSGGTIGGTTSVAAVAGVASFSGLTFTKAGTYTLTAACSGLTSATSTTITVNAASASQLVIAQQPTTGRTYFTLGSIIVNVEDQYGNVVTGNTATVTLSSTTTLSGTTSVAAVAGVATFSNVWITTIGNFTLTATSSGLTSASSSSIAIAPTGFTTLATLNNTTGKNPQMGLIMDSSGNLYGTTTAGGSGTGGGTAFEVAAGTHAVTVLESGGAPYSGLVMDSSGNLYGTTTTGGTYGDGSIYEIPAGTSNATTLASFNGTNGEIPANFMVIDSSGNLYGVASSGGANSDGTVFELAHGSSTITLLASFNGTNGRVPYGGVVLDSSGNLYGTTEAGGASSDGTIWEVSAGSGTITALASFSGTNGVSPDLTNLIRDSSGDLFGTTNGGGAYGDGAVFELPHGSSTITALASFNGTNGNDGQGLVMDANGNFYGVTSSGGANNQGVLWRVAAGTSVVTDLVTFTGSTNGSAPIDRLLMDSSGNLYGTTGSGGANNDGIVFEFGAVTDTAVIASQPTSAAAFTGQSITVNLNNSSGSLDTTDQSPVTLSLVSGPTGGVLGGTTTVSAVNGVASFSGLTFNKVGTYVLAANSNGAFSCQTTSITVTHGVATQVVFTTQPANAMSGSGFGTVVSVEDAGGNLVTNDNSTVSLTVTDGTALHGTTSVQAINGVATFTNLSINPLGSRTLNASDGSLTGAVSSSFTISARTTSITGLANFTNSTGYTPSGNIVMDSSGDIFGTARYGGAYSDGTVWEVAAGTTTLTTFASFGSSSGSTPYGGLTIDSAGDLFGTTETGGTYGDGTVFEIAHGTSTITTLASFNGGNGENPYDTVYIDSAGNLYGTAPNGGGWGDGTVWKLANGSNSIATIASFTPSTGGNPCGTVVMDSSGDIFSTTRGGGTYGDGTVFEIAAGTSTITTLVNFTGANGANPDAGLVMDSAGNLYGTTYTGNNWGTAFKIAAGTSTLTTLGTMLVYTNITTPLTLDANGNLFGTAYEGGVNTDGNSTLGEVFEIPAGTSTVNNLGSFVVATNGKLPLTNAVLDSSGDIFTTASTDDVTYKGYLDEIVALPPATQVVFNSQPTTVTAGTSQTLTANIESATGVVLASSATGTLSIASGPSGAALGGTLTVTDTNGTLTFSGITFNKPGNYTLEITSPGLTTATSNTITVNVGAASKTVFTQVPSTAVAGQNIGTVIVDITDLAGNLITGSTATVTLSGTGLTGTLSVAAVGGVATFNNLTITTSGNPTITASSSGLTAGTTSAITVSPAAAVKLAFAQQPVNAQSGQSIGTVIVDVEDTYGNIVTTGNSMVTLTASDGASITGTASVTAVNGVATFTGLSFVPTGTRSLVATDGSLTTATSNSITISAYTGTPATQAVFTSQPTTVSTHASQSFAVTLESAGGLIIADSGQVTLSIASGPAGATLGGTTTVTAVNGVASFTGITFSAVGTYTLTASSSGLTSATSSSIVFSLPLDVWSGSGDNQTWSSGANWQGGYAPVSGQSVDFPNIVSNQTTINLGQNVTVGDLTVAGFDVFPNYTITVDGNLASDSTNPNAEINSEVVLTHNTTVTVSAGDYLSLRSPSNGGNGYGITKEGAGYLELYGSSEPSLTSEAALGTLEVDNTTIGTVTVDSGATLQGNGVIGGITDDGGTLRPSDNSNDATTLNSSGPVSLGSGSTLDEVISQGISLGTGELHVTGSSTINLSGSTLDVSLQNGVTPSIGNVITLISNQTGSAVTGTFNGLAAGSILRSGNSFFQISYAGGSSQQDVTLTVVAPPVDVWTGTAGDGNWSTAGNWTYGVPETGQSVDFPNLSSTQTTVNVTGDLTAGNITMEGNYSFNGAHITVEGNITASNTDDDFSDYTFLTQNTTLTVGQGDNLIWSSSINSPTVSGTGYSVTIVGGGTVRFANGTQATYTGGTTVQDGTLDNESEIHAAVTVDAGGTVQGGGQFDSGITSDGGTIVLGTNQNFNATDTSTVSLSSGTTIQEDLANNIWQCGELVVDSGAINLTGSNLTLDTGIGIPAVGQVFPLISNQTGSAVTGTFNGLAEGAIFQSGGSWFQISYAGGTSGQDVTLTVVAPPSQLAFIEQPTTAVAGQLLSSVKVAVENSTGDVITSDNSTITLSSGTAFSGTATAQVVDGVATFSNLVFDHAGAQVLSAADGSLSGASSNTFTIAPAAATQLVFVPQPTSAIEGKTIGSFAVEVQDAYGNLVTTDNSAVTITTNDGTPLGGTASVNATGGVATFSNLTFTLPGSHSLLASDGSLTSASTSSITVTPALATLKLTAPANSVTRGQTLQITASGIDGSGAPIALDPVTWSLDSGSVGSIDQNGLFSAGSISEGAGTATVIATCDGQTATMTITVNAIPPVITVNAYAQMVSSTSNTGTLHVAGEQDGTDANLIYTWSIISQPTVESDGLNVGASAGSPAPLAIFAINGTNTAKNTPVTFLASGQYVLQVVASDGTQSVTSQVQVTAKVNPKVTPATLSQTTTVSGVQTVGTGQSITGFVVTFNGPVDPTTAQNVLGYRVQRQYTVSEGRSFWQQIFGGSPGTQTMDVPYKIASAVYDSQSYSVTLTLVSPMPVKDGVGLVKVIGTGAHAVLGANGKAIDGDGNGKAGGNFTYSFNMQVAKTVTYQTVQGDSVKLTLTGPGEIASILPSGTLTPVIDLIDTDSANSILTGELRKGKKSLGYAVLDQLNGTNQANIQLGNEFHVNQYDVADSQI